MMTPAPAQDIPAWFTEALRKREPRETVVQKIEASLREGVEAHKADADLWSDDFIRAYAEIVFNTYESLMQKKA